MFDANIHIIVDIKALNRHIFCFEKIFKKNHENNLVIKKFVVPLHPQMRVRAEAVSTEVHRLRLERPIGGFWGKELGG